MAKTPVVEPREKQDDPRQTAHWSTADLTEPQEKQDDFPEEVAEIIDQIPDPKARSQMRTVVSSQFGMMGRVSPQMSISKKITSEHISDSLEIQKIEVQNAKGQQGKAAVFSLRSLFC